MIRLEPRLWSADEREAAAAALALRSENFRACRLAERACRDLPGRAWPRVLLARLSWKRDLPQALRLLGQARRAEPGEPFAECFTGNLLLKAGRPRQALAWLERGLATRPFARALAWRAQARLALGDPAGARRDLDAAARAEPRRAVVFSARAALWERLGRWRRADQDLTKALRLTLAKTDAAQAVETEPSREESAARLLFRRFRARGRARAWDGALRDLASAHARDPKYAWTGGADGTEGLGLRELDAALRERPRDARLPAWRARARLDAGDFSGAQDDARRALTLRGAPPWTSCWLAEALLRLGRTEEAAALARRTTRALPAYAKARGLLAELELRQGRYAAAAGHARRAIRLYHCAAWAYGHLGEALIGQAKFREARRAFDQVIEWEPGNGRWYLLRALARACEGSAGAREDLRLARRHCAPADQLAWLGRALREVRA